MEKGYKKLIVWKKADELAYQIYLITQNFPKEEIYVITSQLRRSSLSVPTNIVEGFARKSNKELKRFCNIALGSLAETEYLIEFSLKIEYINKKQYNEVQKIREEVGRLLCRFHQSL